MVLALLPLSFVAGLLGAGISRGPVLNELLSTLYIVATLGILFHWVQLDSAQRKTSFSWPLKIALIVVTVIALPYYFFKSRGFLGGLKLGAQAWLIFIASMLCYRLGHTL